MIYQKNAVSSYNCFQAAPEPGTGLFPLRWGQ